MTPWQRRLRFGIGLFIPLFAGVVFFSLRTPPAKPSEQPVVAKDPKAMVQSTKGRITSAAGAKQKFTLDYDVLLTYPNGALKGTGVKVFVPQRAGRDFTIWSKDAETNGDQSLVTMKGDVRLATSDGLTLETPEAAYSNGDGMVRAPGAVAFSKGSMHGTAVGMTYDRNRDVLWLLDRVEIHMESKDGRPGSDVTAGAVGFARLDKYVRFERGMNLVREGQTIEADGAVAYLTEDEQHIQMLELRGASRISGHDPAPGGLKSMSSRDMNLNYREDGTTLERALLSGSGAIDLAGQSPRDRGAHLAGEWIDIALAGDGTTVTGLVGRDNVGLSLPAEKGTPARVIRSTSLEATGTDREGLTRATFGEGVEFHETPAPPAKPRVGRASVMTLTLKGGFNSIEAARFNGNFRFEEGGMTARARDARYVLSSGTLDMEGPDERTGDPPQVVDEQVSIQGRRIAIRVEGRHITATDAVKSNIRPGKSAAAPDRPTRVPAMLDQDQPVSATSDSLEYDGATSKAVYTGHAQLWQGDTAIKAQTVTLDDATGNLTASGGVVSRMALRRTDEATKKTEAVQSLVTAADMVYEDALRRATYSGSVHMIGPEGDLTADRLEIFLTKEGKEVDRMEAYTGITLKTPEGRKATGVRLTYLARDERYLMTGAPVKIVEECRETTGKTLTFFRSTDRIIVDGNEQKRTEWKGVSNCAQGPRFD
jgi:LPS export ABC transporter protein LptC